jgi:hypothetical protein
MVQQFARVARPYLVLLAIFAIARWLMGTAFEVPYDKGTGLFSIVTLTIMASLFSTGYTRRWLRWGLGRAALFAMFLAVASQVVILVSTALSYGLGLATYFNHPTALNQPEAIGAGRALGLRVVGLVVNTFLNGIAGALGWALGGLLPASREGSERA